MILIAERAASLVEVRSHHCYEGRKDRGIGQSQGTARCSRAVIIVELWRPKEMKLSEQPWRLRTARTTVQYLRAQTRGIRLVHLVAGIWSDLGVRVEQVARKTNAMS